jgi:hypothetical protein
MSCTHTYTAKEHIPIYTLEKPVCAGTSREWNKILIVGIPRHLELVATYCNLQNNQQWFNGFQRFLVPVTPGKLLKRLPIIFQVEPYS